jgi:hypothetical protein
VPTPIFAAPKRDHVRESAGGKIGMCVVISPSKEIPMTYIYRTLQSPLFWDKKIRIAILTLATFIALC